MENLETAKCYTPSIEEFHVGFEYEKECNGQWVNITLTKPEYLSWLMDEIEQWINIDRVRVKYLDQEDIISVGFTLVDDYDDVGQATFEKGEWFVIWTRDATEIHYGEDMVFCGKVKNKSEFKRILNQVNIYENSSSNELEKAW